MGAALDISVRERPERRITARVIYDAAVECEIQGDRVLEYIGNLSPGGAAIRVHRLRAPLGAPITLRMRVPGTPSRAALQGRVVRVDIDSTGGATVAVRFVDLPDPVRLALERFVEP